MIRVVSKAERREAQYSSGLFARVCDKPVDEPGPVAGNCCWSDCCIEFNGS